MAFKTTVDTDPLTVLPDSDVAETSTFDVGTEPTATPGRFLSRAHPARLLRWVVRPRQVTFTPSTHRIAGPLMFTRGGLFATFVLGGQPWDFRSHGDRLQLWDQGTFRWSRLEGRPVKLRSTPMPYPSWEFARSLDEDTPIPAAGRGRRADLEQLSGAQPTPAATDRSRHQAGHLVGVDRTQPETAGPSRAGQRRRPSPAGDGTG